ncbi:2-dehydro-3-deoxy-D-gluconate 5-dehydrogenase KduD [Photobacterium toruni]|uniref:2-dehydro-3-deoxy-D-gluconate 5-dehydrogenase n=1 Tax=Photobacterium toruni TaxID=1935446 RepID=A0A1T4SVI8_9GAMM|nr:2-dehydro-3-deoxy-D-gluconate 5-dehydrogenase KduD [Photobacterium toruni]MEC6830226.1 2-dehydro-3-deoxy-D-gluconate 5-dehydrogenase KduD [Photobacterium toruni]SKA32213.1 2-dehydro-3-deoxy-D-gluconate 5-dehydrogenase [Photobacterium toruni]
MNMFDLSGKVAIVTGCNTGLGQGMALGLAKAGADIVGIGHQAAPETQVQVEALGRKFHYITANLMQQDKLESIVAEAVEVMGHVDILINNAGIIRRQDLLKFSESDWDDVININQKTLFFLSQAVAKRFVEQGNGGKIINIASMLSFQGGIRVPSYTASKSAVMGLTRALATELAEYNINVNAIAPGYMATDNTEALRADADRNAAILERIPANRWGLPSDLEGPAVFLASSASDYINGYTIAVDGGWLAR